MATAKTYFVYDEADYMDGPYVLDRDVVDQIDRSVYGVYVLLAEAARGNDLLVVYVGRGQIHRRLVEHIRDEDGDYFAFVEHDNEEVRFLQECRLFHKYGKRPHLDNRIHPARTYETSLPKCSQMGCDGEPD